MLQALFLNALIKQLRKLQGYVIARCQVFDYPGKRLIVNTKPLR